MYTFNQPKIKALKPESRNQNVIKNCCGFTLIELLFAIATVAVLIALLLPVIQRKREEYAANKATQNLMAMIEASNAYRMRMGSYPNTIPQLVQFCGTNPGLCSLDPQLANGSSGGYLYRILVGSDGGVWRIEAEPEFPGITGSITVIIDVDFSLTSMATPGADAVRQQAFDNILKQGAETAVQLLNLDPTEAATSQVRGYVGATTVNAGTQTSVFTTLNTNHDGMVSVQECISGQGAGDPIPTELLGSFLAAVSRELRLDMLDAQSGQDIAVTMAELDQTQPSLFSIDELQHLTRIVVNGGEGDDILATKLQAAEDAEASGNLNRKAKSLKQYRKRVNKLIGTSVTRTEANTLIALANCIASS